MTRKEFEEICNSTSERLLSDLPETMLAEFNEETFAIIIARCFAYSRQIMFEAFEAAHLFDE